MKSLENGDDTSSIRPTNSDKHEPISVESEQAIIALFNEVNFCAVDDCSNRSKKKKKKKHVLNHYSKNTFQIQTQNFRIAHFTADKSQIQKKIQSNNGLTKCSVPELRN